MILDVDAKTLKKNYYKAYQDKLAGMTYDQIAKKYKVTKSAVQAWQKRYWRQWDNDGQEQPQDGQNAAGWADDGQKDGRGEPEKLVVASRSEYLTPIVSRHVADTSPSRIYAEYSRDNLPQLSDREARFVEEYIIDLDKKFAAIRAGYSVQSADVLGCRVYDRPAVNAHIQVALAERMKRSGMSADLAIRELGRIGRANPAKVLTEDGGINPNANEDDLAAIQSVKVKTIPAKGGGEPIVEKEIRFHDKTKALELYMKAAGMLIDKKQIDVTTKTDTMTDNDLDSKIQAYLDKATINVTPEK